MSELHSTRKEGLDSPKRPVSSGSPAVVSLPTMPRRCHECAFSAGTEANRARWTQVTIELCLIARIPFYCHAQGEPAPACAGFVEARKTAPEHPDWRRRTAEKLLELQHIAETSPQNAQYVMENFNEVFKALMEE